MTNFQLEQYEEQLNHQVIHMDQAACYCPEFRATKLMHHYPSRRLQLARAVYKGEMPVSDYIGELNFAGILSRQGERWQNFRESPEDCTDVTILCREMLLKKGYVSPAANAFRTALSARGGRLYEKNIWNFPISEQSKKAILLDEETADKTGAGVAVLSSYLEKQGISFVNKAESEFVGFEFFAYGLTEEGTAHLKKLIEKYEAMHVEEVYVLSAQAAYVLTGFAGKLGLPVSFKVVYLPEQLAAFDIKEKTYVYAGSFNLRYLVNAGLINRLIPAESDVQEPNSQEFIPLLKGGKRVNKLTIWQKPVGAEYKLYNPDGAMMEAIAADAFADMEKSGAETIIVFEPTALPAIREQFPNKKVLSYLELL